MTLRVLVSRVIKRGRGGHGWVAMWPARGNYGPEDIAAQSAVAMHKRAAKEPAGSERLGVQSWLRRVRAGRMEEHDKHRQKIVGASAFREETLKRTQIFCAIL